jgi:hypothetical protein
MSETINKNVINNPCGIGTSCRSFQSKLNSNDPAIQYQIQKIIQNSVRVKSSLYTMNLGALNVYQQPSCLYALVNNSGSNYIVSPGVNWNQMSDRREPHIQEVTTSSGSAYRSSSTRHTITGSRPGAQSPGGCGVDIKHNSYDRYLNRLKGKGPIKRGIIPPTFGLPIPFNRAYPVYGGKTIKTSIVSGCNCDCNNDYILSKNSDTQNQIFDVVYTFNVGDYVFAKKNDDLNYEKGIITDITDGLYTILFIDGTKVIRIKCQLLIYYDCGICSNNTD